jgi:acetyl esterase/lipase
MKTLLHLALTALLPIALIAAEPAPSAPKAKAKTPAKAKAKPAEPLPPPATFADVRYGDHERNLLDFWQAPSAKPTPVLFFIHGGGWNSGDKTRVAKFINIEEFRAAGISVVSINYRLVPQSHEDGVTPPVKAPLHDATRALQFVRSKAAEWNLDKQRIGACGGSAGACSSLWLAFHDDLADPTSSDPIARESTRLLCASVSGAQTTLDPAQMVEWTPNSHYGAHAFGIFKTVNDKLVADFPTYLAERERLLPWITEYSPYALVSAGDPPVHLVYTSAPALGQDQKDPTHTANFGLKLQEHCLANGVACELVYPGAAAVTYPTSTAYLLAKLKP